LFAELFRKASQNGRQHQEKEGEAEGLPGTLSYPSIELVSNAPQKPKLKVGKAKAKPDNFTDTSFKSKGMLAFRGSFPYLGRIDCTGLVEEHSTA
jgi:hypothetical protein